MGLNFTHSDVRWSYTSFGDFREHLAASIGINLNDMDGFGGNTPWETVKDPIKLFLDHSDCEGTLVAWEMRLIAPRIKQIVTDWPTEEDGNTQLGIHRERALQLANDMEALLERDGDNAVMTFI